MSSRKRRKSSVQSHFSPSAKGVAALFLFVGLLVAAGVILPRLTEKNQPEPQPASLPWQAELPPAGGASLSVHLPVLTFPAVAEAVPPGPQFSFTEEEVAVLNEMIGLWAEEETFIRVVPPEEDSSSSGASSSSSQSASQSTAQSASKAQSTAQPEYKADGGHDVAVWFLDIQSGAQYVYNDQFPFYYASTMKAPYAAWLYTLAQDGACDLEDMIEVKPEDIGKYKDNTGKLKSMDLPADFSVESLIGMMLENSDTVALKLLLARYPAADFRQWAQEQGVQNADALNSVVSGKATAADMGVLTAAVYRVMEEGQYGPQLRQHMENAGNRMVASDYPVAHKYGWDEHAYHDMAVVYAPHPYLVVIMTDKWAGSYKETAQFGTLSRTMEAMMAEKWAAYEAQAG